MKRMLGYGNKNKRITSGNKINSGSPQVLI